MKKTVLPWLLCLALLAPMVPARANQWGATGPLLAFLESTHDFDDYPQVVAAQAVPGNLYVPAVVSNREHSQLLLLKQDDAGRLHQVGRYPAAIHPPYMVRDLRLEALPEGGFELQLTRADTRELEIYLFDMLHYDPFTNEHSMALASAWVSGLRIQRGEANAYEVIGGDSTLWQVEPIPLKDFCMGMLPHSVDEARHLNQLREALGPDPVSDRAVQVSLNLKERRHVHAAPSATGWRGAKGRAALSFNAPFSVLAATPDGVWWLVRYDISFHEGRVGYVMPPQGVQVPLPVLHLVPRPLTLGQEAILTDDPYGNRRAMRMLPAGESVQVLGWVDACWALVETQIDGLAAQGFVPLAALSLPQEQPQPALMQALEGSWLFVSGGEMMGTLFTLEQQGRWPLAGGRQGRYAAYAPADPGDTGVLDLRTPDGALYRYRYVLAPGGDRLTLMRSEAGGTYARITLAPSPLLPEGALLSLGNSQRFTRAEREQAVRAILERFAGMGHLGALALYYAGDQASLEEGQREYAQGFDQVMLFYMDVVAKDGQSEDSGHDPGDVIGGWMWSVGRGSGGDWRVLNDGLQ